MVIRRYQVLAVHIGESCSVSTRTLFKYLMEKSDGRPPSARRESRFDYDCPLVVKRVHCNFTSIYRAYMYIRCSSPDKPFKLNCAMKKVIEK